MKFVLILLVLVYTVKNVQSTDDNDQYFLLDHDDSDTKSVEINKYGKTYRNNLQADKLKTEKKEDNKGKKSRSRNKYYKSKSFDTGLLNIFDKAVSVFNKLVPDITNLTENSLTDIYKKLVNKWVPAITGLLREVVSIVDGILGKNVQADDTDYSYDADATFEMNDIDLHGKNKRSKGNENPKTEKGKVEKKDDPKKEILAKKSRSRYLKSNTSDGLVGLFDKIIKVSNKIFPDLLNISNIPLADIANKVAHQWLPMIARLLKEVLKYADYLLTRLITVLGNNY